MLQEFLFRMFQSVSCHSFKGYYIARTSDNSQGLPKIGVSKAIFNVEKIFFNLTSGWISAVVYRAVDIEMEYSLFQGAIYPGTLVGYTQKVVVDGQRVSLRLFDSGA